MKIVHICIDECFMGSRYVWQLACRYWTVLTFIVHGLCPKAFWEGNQLIGMYRTVVRRPFEETLVWSVWLGRLFGSLLGRLEQAVWNKRLFWGLLRNGNCCFRRVLNGQIVADLLHWEWCVLTFPSVSSVLLHCHTRLCPVYSAYTTGRAGPCTFRCSI